ncbi:MAG TPA: STAS domain-containing protein [Acidimicrobiales bacterium]|nr:STAS domain-containing protein [Acidimicrobiales bacterium]
MIRSDLPALLDVDEHRCASTLGVPTAVLSLRGEMDADGAGPLRDRINELAGEGVGLVVADLREVSFLGATGLGVLAGGAARLRRGGGDLVLVLTHEGPVARVLALTGVDQAVSVFSTPQEAVG